MLLYKLTLNGRNKAARRDIGDPYEMHSTLCRAFSPPDQICSPSAFLWRLEQSEVLECNATVYVQSSLKPDWSRIDAEWCLKPPEEIVDLSLFCERIETRKLYRFRLRGNPCKTTQGKRVGLYRNEDQIQWLQRKGEMHGFVVEAEVKPNCLCVRLSRDQNLIGTQRKEKRQIKVFSIQFDGLLRVTDVNKFTQAISTGIGHGKTMGLGLLSLREVHEN